jgi:cyclohexyl-isocyanide hydratase
MNTKKLKIAMLCYPDMTLLDLVGPETVFSQYADIYLVWKTLTPVQTDTNISINPNCTFIDCPDDLDIIFAPGGPGAVEMIQDEAVLSFLREKSLTSQYITAVCTGSLILAAAGLLKGIKATTHWSVRDELAMLGATVVNQRVVVDGNRITGGGITSGIDFGLEVVAKVISEDAAKAITLLLEYDPNPPYACGTPDKAGDRIVDMLWSEIAPMKAKLATAINNILREKKRVSSVD